MAEIVEHDHEPAAGQRLHAVAYLVQGFGGVDLELPAHRGASRIEQLGLDAIEARISGAVGPGDYEPTGGKRGNRLRPLIVKGVGVDQELVADRIASRIIEARLHPGSAKIAGVVGPGDDEVAVGQDCDLRVVLAPCTILVNEDFRADPGPIWSDQLNHNRFAAGISCKPAIVRPDHHVVSVRKLCRGRKPLVSGCPRVDEDFWSGGQCRHVGSPPGAAGSDRGRNRLAQRASERSGVTLSVRLSKRLAEIGWQVQRSVTRMG